ncbi:MAG: ATP-binding protein [Methanomicrobiales archaeon]|nr:ATP-binding protein [Methanomicrobiales archaeon]
MTRFFNTAGPVRCESHYCLPPLSRLNLDEVLNLIDQQKYFVLHAPRQTGKTSCLLALMEYLNQRETYRCLYVNFEVGQGYRDRVSDAMAFLTLELSSRARDSLNDPIPGQIRDTLMREGNASISLNELLTRWTKESPLPIVLLIDEVDALVGDTLISVLRQLRAGYDKRPTLFPHTIILCGVRDVRDYRIHSDNDNAIITGVSAFNIRAKSLLLGDFSRREMENLYLQHTRETGQVFTQDALDLAWELTMGQPWLVNALAYETCFEAVGGYDRSKPITIQMIQEAKEDLIFRRETHLDQLTDKLSEERVQRVIEPVLAGIEGQIREDDVRYVIDLGLLKRTMNGGLRLANGIYQEVIPRELAYPSQIGMRQETAWYVRKDGTLDISSLLCAFQQFYREHSEAWLKGIAYKEAAPQLLLQAFLQRVVNGGGRIEREYGLGRGRTDLLVIWQVYPRTRQTPQRDLSGEVSALHAPTNNQHDENAIQIKVSPRPLPPDIHQKVIQRMVIELKVLHCSLKCTVQKGLEQTWDYMDRCGAQEGHLVVFDRNSKKPWSKKIFCRSEPYREGEVIVWGM